MSVSQACRLLTIAQGVASVVVSIAGDEMRGAVLGLGIPLWLIAAEIVAARERSCR